MHKIAFAALTVVALSGCGPTLWSLQDACRQGDQGACTVAQQRLQMLGMSSGMMATSGALLSQPSRYTLAAPATPTTCVQQGIITRCY